MRVPKMTGLQFLVLRLLLEGAKSGRELRAELREWGVETSQSSFSQLMQRLERAGLVRSEYAATVVGERTLRHRVYQGTVTGLKAWREVRQYYGSFSEPGEGVEERVFDDVAEAAAEEAFVARFVELGGRLGRGGRKRG